MPCLKPQGLGSVSPKVARTTVGLPWGWLTGIGLTPKRVGALGIGSFRVVVDPRLFLSGCWNARGGGTLIQG